MIKKYLVVAILISGFLMAGNAYGEMSAKKLLDLYDEVVRDNLENSKKLIFVTFRELGNGIFWTNVELKIKNQPEVYCSPKNLSITTEQSISLFRQYLKEFPGNGKFSPGLVLLKAYQYTSPCEEQQPQYQ